MFKVSYYIRLLYLWIFNLPYLFINIFTSEQDSMNLKYSISHVSETFNTNSNPQERPPFKLRIELHRLLTFPLYEPGVAKKELAKNGFFLQLGDKNIECYFCKSTAENYKRFKQNNLRDMISIHANNCPMIDLDQENNNVPFYDTKNYKYEAYRLYTFVDIDWKSPVSPYELARGGYYWTESEDNCRCAFCRLEVRGWEPRDTARGEHERWNPACQFIQGRDCGNIKIGDEITGINGITADGTVQPKSANLIINNPFATSEKHKLIDKNINYMKQEAKKQPVEDLGITFVAPAKYSDRMHVSKRIDSYKFWPVSLPQKPNDLSEAGFFYTGVGDRVLCFQCGGGLKDWSQNDVPWIEHAKWFPNCSYLSIKKGKMFIDSVIKENSTSTFFLDSNSNSFTDSCNGASFTKTSTSEMLTCSACNKVDIDAVNLPCGHMEYCFKCRNDIHDDCKICKKPINATVHVFLA